MFLGGDKLHSWRVGQNKRAHDDNIFYIYQVLMTLKTITTKYQQLAIGLNTLTYHCAPSVQETNNVDTEVTEEQARVGFTSELEGLH